MHQASHKRRIHVKGPLNFLLAKNQSNAQRSKRVKNPFFLDFCLKFGIIHTAQQGKVSGPVYLDIFVMAGRPKSNNLLNCVYSI